VTDAPTTPRRAMSRMRRLRIFEAGKGICYLCDHCIHVGEKWDVEHIVPLALGGADDVTNMAPAHKACHAPKTAADFGRIAKAKRMKARHIGIRKRSSFPKPPPGMRFNWKQRRYVREAT